MKSMASEPGLSRTMQSIPGVRQTQNQASKRKVLQLGANPSTDCLNDKA